MTFSEKSLDFLAENRLMDSREWFHEHKKEYEELVLFPIQDTIEAVTPAMQEIDPALLCDPRVGKGISRLWRDTRFMSDKTIFRDNIWFTFIRDKHSFLPGFFFEVSPRGMAWGCGWYCTDSKITERMRSLILSDSPVWREALRAFKAQASFILADEHYKRSRFPDEPPERREWLDLKSVCLIRECTDIEVITGDGIPEMLARDFALIAPVYGFLMECMPPEGIGRRGC